MTDTILFHRLQNGAPAASRCGDTVVPWWSVTKTAIAATALCLVAERRLELDASMDGAAFSLRQVLQHRAGIGNYGGMTAYNKAVARGDEPWTRREFLERTEAARLRRRPGEAFAYSNIGYLIAVEAIERTAGEDIGAAMERRLLGPLGLSGVRLAQTRGDLDGVAMGGTDYHPGWVAHGLLVGPLAQAARMMDGILGGAVLAPDALEEMRRGIPVEDGPVRSWREPAYGLGLMTDPSLPGAPCGHTGGGPGSVIAVYRTERDGVAQTVAAFSPGADEAAVEAFAMA